MAPNQHCRPQNTCGSRSKTGEGEAGPWPLRETERLLRSRRGSQAVCPAVSPLPSTPEAHGSAFAPAAPAQALFTGSGHRRRPPAARCQATECCLNTTPHLGPPTGLAGRREEGQGEALAGTAPGGSSGEPRQAPSVPESEQMGGKTDSLACGRQTEREAGGKASVSPCHVLEGPPGVFDRICHD